MARSLVPWYFWLGVIGGAVLGLLVVVLEMTRYPLYVDLAGAFAALGAVTGALAGLQCAAGAAVGSRISVSRKLSPKGEARFVLIGTFLGAVIAALISVGFFWSVGFVQYAIVAGGVLAALTFAAMTLRWRGEAPAAS